MYCGMSLARVGLDIRGLLPPIFEACVLNLFSKARRLLSLSIIKACSRSKLRSVLRLPQIDSAVLSNKKKAESKLAIRTYDHCYASTARNVLDTAYAGAPLAFAHEMLKLAGNLERHNITALHTKS